MPGYIERACVLAENDTDCAGRRCPRWHFITECIVIVGLLVPTAHAQTRTTFDIDAGPAAQSLNLYAQQARVQLGFSAEAVGGIRTNPVKGAYETAEALELLLAGTGLAADHGDKGIIIHQAIGLETKNDEKAPTKTAGLNFNRETAQVVPTSATKHSAVRSAKPAGKLEEIVVTGTQIRDTAPVGANVITLDRDYIERTGLPTTQQLIQSVPQNFGGGANEAEQAVGIGAGTMNAGYSSSVNLRGLGTDSSLLLLNGRRSAPGGARGDFIDLNSIPTAAIERIEVLPDGASAIYGSDAIGGVINVILRDDYEGGESAIRYAPGTSDIEEVCISQVLGASWRTGNALFAYEYYDRSDLKSADRTYTADSDLTSLGGTDHSVAASNPGNITGYTLADGTTQTVQYAIPHSQDGRSLTPEDLLSGSINLQNIREGTSVLPYQTRHSAFMAASQDLSEKTDLFAEVRYSTRTFDSRGGFALSNQITVPSSNPFFVDPFGGSTALRMNYYYNDDYGPQRRFGEVDTSNAVLGVTRSLTETWELEVYGSYGIEKTFSGTDKFPNTALLSEALADPDADTAFNPFGDGSYTNPATLASIEGYTKSNFESDLTVLNIRADGNLFEMRGGPAKVAIGAQFREEAIFSDVTRFSSTSEPVFDPGFDLDRDVRSVFAELYFPFVTERNRRTAINHFALSIAGRYERYSDFGGTFDPKLGLAWSPLDGLDIRGTVGTSFRAPLLTEIGRSDLQILLFNAPDPASSTGITNMLLLFANSRHDLEPQEGTTWTAGFDVTPPAFSGVTVGLTYFETAVDKLISLPPGNIFSPLLDPTTYAPIIDKGPDGLGPDIARVAALFDDPAFVGTPIPPEEVGAIVDFRVQNLASAELSGLDLNARSTFDSAAGVFDLQVYASYLFHFKEQLINGPLTDNLDTVTNPISIQLRSSLGWRAGGFNAALTANHIGDYVNTRTTPESHVNSWTIWDMAMGYDFGETADGFLHNAKVSLHVQNILDAEPPFVDASVAGVGFDATNANPLGRFAAIQLSKSW